MIVLDTTVLIYAKGADHALRDPCRALIEAIADGAVEATTTPEVIQEFTHVRARRRGAQDAAALGRDYAELLSPLLTVGRSQLEQGLSLFASASQIGAFDAVLAITAIEADALHLVSADRAFTGVEELNVVFPDGRGVAILVGQ